MMDARLHFEDFPVGETVLLDPVHEVTRDDIVTFASQFDPQDFHLDDEAAKDTLLGGLAASGWHSCAIVMRLMSDGYISRSAGLGSPGLDEVRWLKPVRPGDRLRLRRTCLAARRSASRPDMGICTFLWELLNAADAVVLDMRGQQMFKIRAPLAAGETA